MVIKYIKDICNCNSILTCINQLLNVIMTCQKGNSKCLCNSFKTEIVEIEIYWVELWLVMLDQLIIQIGNVNM